MSKTLAETTFMKILTFLSHHKNLNYGDYLIDDRLANGANLFKGEHIHFGSDKFPDWESVCSYLL